MNTKNFVTVATVALGTATLTVTIFLGATIEAENDALPLAPTIARPELVASGVKMTLARSTEGEFRAGATPAFDLQAVNTRAERTEVRVRIAMTAVAPSSPLSRMVVIPMELWREERALVLGPNETKTFFFNATTNLPANKVFSVTMLAVDSPATATDSANKGTGLALNPPPLFLSRMGIEGLTFSTVPPVVALASLAVPRSAE